MSKLTRELGATNLEANIGFTNSTEVKNDYDNRYPWSDMRIVIDENNNKWLQIPKFYTKYELDENGYICARYISRYNVNEDWYLNPAFLSPSGRELSSIEIACYQTSIETTTNMPISQSGRTVDKGRKLAAMRSLVDNYDLDEKYDYSLYDIWTHILIQDLLLIEFAESNPNTIMPGYSAANYMSKGLLKTGTTDNIAEQFKSGIPCETTDTYSNYGMVYRNMENIIGNGTTILDNIIIQNGVVSVKVNGREYQVSQTVPTNSGQVDKLFFDKNTKLVYPAVVKDNGSYGNTYNGSSSTNRLIVQMGGIFAYQLVSENGEGSYKTYRMVRKQK